MSSLFDAPRDQHHLSLTLIIFAVSIGTFGLFGGLYFLSLNAGHLITAPAAVEKAPPAWIPPEERVSAKGPLQPAKAPKVTEGQF